MVNEIAQRFLKELKEVPENTLEIEAIENLNPTEEGKGKYLMVAKLQTPEEDQTEDTEGEISITAFGQRGGYAKEEPWVKEEYHERQSPWWTSKNASKQLNKRS